MPKRPTQTPNRKGKLAKKPVETAIDLFSSDEEGNPNLSVASTSKGKSPKKVAKKGERAKRRLSFHGNTSDSESSVDLTLAELRNEKRTKRVPQPKFKKKEEKTEGKTDANAAMFAQMMQMMQKMQQQNEALQEEVNALKRKTPPVHVEVAETQDDDATDVEEVVVRSKAAAKEAAEAAEKAKMTKLRELFQKHFTSGMTPVEVLRAVYEHFKDYLNSEKIEELIDHFKKVHDEEDDFSELETFDVQLRKDVEDVFVAPIRKLLEKAYAGDNQEDVVSHLLDQFKYVEGYVITNYAQLMMSWFPYAFMDLPHKHKVPFDVSSFDEDFSLLQVLNDAVDCSLAVEHQFVPYGTPLLKPSRSSRVTSFKPVSFCVFDTSVEIDLKQIFIEVTKSVGKTYCTLAGYQKLPKDIGNNKGVPLDKWVGKEASLPNDYEGVAVVLMGLSPKSTNGTDNDDILANGPSYAVVKEETFRFNLWNGEHVVLSNDLAKENPSIGTSNIVPVKQNEPVYAVFVLYNDEAKEKAKALLLTGKKKLVSYDVEDGDICFLSMDKKKKSRKVRDDGLSSLG